MNADTKVYSLHHVLDFAKYTKETYYLDNYFTLNPYIATNFKCFFISINDGTLDNSNFEQYNIENDCEKAFFVVDYEKDWKLLYGRTLTFKQWVVTN